MYYAALRGTPFKWLDVFALFQNNVLGDDIEVTQVRYYTAFSKGSSSDDPTSPHRQRRYLHALKAYRGDRIEIIYGFIARTTPYLRLVNMPQGGSIVTKARVYQFTEKQTDVNLAADLISDAWRNNYKRAVVCSNDSDLVGALTAVQRDHPDVVLGLVSPARDVCHISRDLKERAAWCKTFDATHLARAQLPERIPGTHLSRPPQWSGAAANLDSIHEPLVLPENAA